jgi:hypothetical protein
MNNDPLGHNEMSAKQRHPFFAGDWLKSHPMKWIQVVFYLLIAAAVFGISLHVHIRAGLTLPNPWNDEARVFWPSKALVETGTFLVPELNPEREAMLYGGGDAAAFGIFMKVFGFSLQSARWLSWVCTMGAWLAVAGIIWTFPWRHLLLGIAGLFFLAPAHVVAGNMARSEGIVLLLVSVAYWRLVKDRPIQAIFLCGLGVIVHPNALYFLLGAIVYTAIHPALWRRLWPLSRADWFFVACCSLPVVLSALKIMSIWEYFYQDFFVEALPHNLSLNPSKRLLEFRGWLVLLGILFVGGRLLRHKVSLWALYGLVGLWAWVMGGEMWYDVYKMTGFMVIWTGGVVCILLVGQMLTARLEKRKYATTVLKCVAPAGAFLWLTFFGHMYYRHGFIPGPRNYPQKMGWGWGMVMSEPAVPYITPKDMQIVSNMAMDIAGEHPSPIVEFPATGDSCLFIDALPDHATPMLRISTKVPSQVVVYHLSRYIPGWVQKVIVAQMESKGINPDQPDYQRDQTEKWFLRAVLPTEQKVDVP